jgi:hypothetical protein
MKLNKKKIKKYCAEVNGYSFRRTAVFLRQIGRKKPYQKYQPLCLNNLLIVPEEQTLQ